MCLCFSLIYNDFQHFQQLFKFLLIFTGSRSPYQGWPSQSILLFFRENFYLVEIILATNAASLSPKPHSSARPATKPSPQLWPQLRHHNFRRQSGTQLGPKCNGKIRSRAQASEPKPQSPSPEAQVKCTPEISYMRRTPTRASEYVQKESFGGL